MSAQCRNQKKSREELQLLIATYQIDPSEELHTIIITHFTHLVESLAAKFARGHEPMEDLVQVGMIGLLAAIKRYDPTFGRTFESFAVPTIIGEIKRHIRDKTWSVHVPRKIKELTPKLKKAVDELTIALQRSPQVAEIAARMGVSEEEVLETMEMGKSYHSLSVDSELEGDSDGGTVTLLDLIGNKDDGYRRIERSLTLEQLFQVLNKRERDIIQLTFYENLSQKQAGDLLGISQMHVSRLQRKALGKLREAIAPEKNTRADS